MDKRFKKKRSTAEDAEERDQFRRDILAHKLSIQDAVKAMRRRSRLTQPEFARHRGVSLATLRQIEAGTGNPSVETLNKIGSVFGLQVGFIPEIEERGVPPAEQRHGATPSFDRREALNQELLKSLARKYVWWKTPEEAVLMPERVIAQVMNIGDYSDVQRLASQVGDEVLRDVLTRAEAGQFNERSWAYWHYRLGLSSPGHVPALPERRFA